MTPATKSQAAIHEAAHAVVANHLGLPVLSAYIEEHPAGAGGAVTYAVSAMDRRFFVAALAGPHAGKSAGIPYDYPGNVCDLSLVPPEMFFEIAEDALALVVILWDEIVRVAQELMVRGVLLGEQLREVLNPPVSLAA